MMVWTYLAYVAVSIAATIWVGGSFAPEVTTA
jgi:hypothetical protein